jgi:hypothetical protein
MEPESKQLAASFAAVPGGFEVIEDQRLSRSAELSLLNRNRLQQALRNPCECGP